MCSVGCIHNSYFQLVDTNVNVSLPVTAWISESFGFIYNLIICNHMNIGQMIVHMQLNLALLYQLFPIYYLNAKHLIDLIIFNKKIIKLVY